MSHRSNAEERFAALEHRLQSVRAELDQCREQVRRYRTLFDAIAEGFAVGELVVDEEGRPCDYRLLEINAACGRLTGVAPAAAKGRTARELLPDVDPHLFEILGRVALTGEPVRLERQFGHLQAWFDLFAYRPASGQVAILLVDITERKRTEQALRENETRLILAQRAAEIGFFDWDIPADRSVWSPQLEAMCGLPAGSGGSRLWPSVVHPDDLASTIAERERCLRNRCPEIRGEYRIVRPTGEVRCLAGRGLIFYDEAGAPLRMVGAFVDITERRRAEEALRQSEARYRREADELNAIYATAPLGMCVVDTELRYVRINERLAEFNGVPVEAHLGRTVRQVLPALADATEAGLRRVLESGEPVLGVEHSGETPARPGVSRTWTSNWWPLKDDAGRVVGISVITEEITERKRMEEALRESEAGCQRQIVELESIYRSVPIGLAVVDDALRYVRVNDHLAEVNGIPAEAHIGKTVQEIVPKVALSVVPVMRGVLETGRPKLDFHVSGETAARPGVRRDWVEHFWPLTDTAGRVVGLNVVVEEITERLRMDAVRRREHEFRTLAENSADAISRFDAGLRGVYSNPATGRLFGHAPEAMVGKTNLELGLPEECATTYHRLLRMAFESKQAQMAELRFPGSEGERIIETRVFPEFGAEDTVETILAVSRDITDRKLAEEALRASEEQYRRLVENLYEGIWQIDAEDNTTFVNARMAEMFGYRQDEMLGKALFEFMDEEAAALARRNLDRGKQGVRADYEFEFLRKDGKALCTRIATAPLFDRSGHYQGALAAVEDISPQKQAEQALRESERRYRSLLEALNEGIWAIDQDSITTFVNPRMAEMLGYRVEEMLGRHLFEFMDEQGVRLAERDLERRRAGISEEHDFEFLRKDGTRIYVRMTTSPLQDGEGNYRGALAGMVDVTARRQAEQALRESESRFRQVIELVPAILYRVPQPGYRAEFISPEVERLIGFTWEDWAADPDIWVRQLHEEDRERVLAEMDVALRHAESYTQEYRMWHKDGRLRWLEDRHRIERDAQGHPVALFGAIIDITDRKRAEEALHQREQEFRALAELSPDIVARIDGALRFLYVSPAIERATGQPPAFFLGKTAWQVGLSPTDASVLAHDVSAAFHSARESRHEFTFSSPEGRVQFFEARVVPEFASDGSVQSVIAVSRDITRLREAEAQVRQKAEQLAQANKRLQALSRRDELTGLANRRYLFERLEAEWRREARHDHAVSLIMADIDHFKAFNDHYGHLAGDDCLRRVADTLNKQIHRPADLLARYGGEEFVVVLPDTSLDGARRMAEAMRRAVEELGVDHQGSPLRPVVTVSLGVAECLPKRSSIEELLARADQALYEAKAAGRNQVRTAREPECGAR